MAYHSKAENLLLAKYGDDGWERRRPNIAKVRDRISRRLYERHNQRMLWVCAIVPALAISILGQIVIQVIR